MSNAIENESFSDILPCEAEPLVRAGAVRVLDVRSPEEFAELGHIPGAMLLPVNLIPCALATVPRDGAQLLICCEHGIRSRAAVRFLAAGGFQGMLHLAGGMAAWSGPREHSPGNPFAGLGPSSWLLECADLLPAAGAALDLACGRGRHALLLAAAGYRVRALDNDRDKVRALGEAAGRAGLAIEAEAADLEIEGAGLGEESFDLILGVHYLHRPLFPAILRALRRGGLLLYETFTIEQAKRGKPTNPAFLLRPGELPELVRPLDILRRREGDFDGRHVAAIAARKP